MMELATGPLPSRPPKAMPAERHADPWGDFLRRVLVLSGPTKDSQVAASPGGALPHSASTLAGRRADLPVE